MRFTSNPSPSIAPARAAVSALRHRLAALITGIAVTTLLAACGGGGGGTTTTYTVGISVNAVGSGETFVFGLGSGQATVIQASTVISFPGSLADGAAYTVNQLSGPRTCTLSANRSGTIAGANVAVTADCGSPPGLASLTGKFYGPVGALAVLQNNGGDDLPVSVTRSVVGTDAYDATAFSFATKLLDGTAYQVTVKTAPAGQTCSVYKGASGTLPVGADALRVGCEYTYDHVSRSTNDAVLGTYFESSAPVIGGSSTAVGATADGYGEGRFVAFVSSAAGMGGATNSHRQVFWRDRLTGQTLLVSASAAATEGNADSFAPAISADGLTVAFESYASNLVAGDTNGVRDVFVWSALNPGAGVTRVSVGAGGIEANAESYEPTLSGDGRVVAFSSGASNLTAGVAGTSTTNVIRRDLIAGANTLISANAAGTGVGGSRPALSEDGKRLAFYSFASTLVAGDANGLWDIFVHDATSGVNTRVSLTSSGGERNQGTESASRVVAPTISGDGRYVAFATTATNMVAGDTNGAQDVFVVDTQNGSVVRASVDGAGVQGNADSPIGQGERVALSSDGRWVAFNTSASNLGTPASNVVMRNWVTGETRVVSSQTGSSVGSVSMSRTGAYVAFGSGSALDGRFSSSGLFVRFTGLARAWWWVD